MTGQQGISSPASLLTALLTDLFSHLNESREGYMSCQGKIHDMVRWTDVFDPGSGILDRFIILVILSRIGLFVPITVRIANFYIRESKILYSRFHNALKMIQ